MSYPGCLHFDAKARPQPTALRLQCWDTSSQTTDRAGTQSHPSADRLPKVFLIPQLPLNTPLDMALPTRGKKPSSTHQWVGTSHFHQEDCTSLLDQPHPPGGVQQKQEELPCSLWDHKHRKLDKMRWQRNMFQTKEQDKTPKEQLSEVEIGNLPEKEFRVMIVKMILEKE